MARSQQAVKLMTPTEVAREFRVDPKTVTRWAKAGKLPFITTLGGHRRYPRAAILAALGAPDEAESEEEAGTPPQPPARCERCEQPFGTCHHTAPPIEVGDVIDELTMTVGRSVRLGELRPSSRALDDDGNVWVKTRRRDGCWENLTDGAIWPLHQIIDARQGYGPLTIEHIAGSR